MTNPASYHPWLLPLGSAIPAHCAGRKAVGLDALRRAGFPVPPGVCLTTDAFDPRRATASTLRIPPGARVTVDGDRGEVKWK